MTDEQKPREFTPAQKALIEEHRGWNVDDFWWYRSVFDDWVEKLEGLGIRVDTGGHNSACGKDRPAIYFSGFASQGDGACFEGTIDIVKFMKAHDLEKDYPAASYVAKQNYAFGTVRHMGHYNHSHSASVSVDFEVPGEFDDPLREAVRAAMEEKFYDEFPHFETAVQDICRGYMDQIYKDLEKEYEYQTSDEAVWASLEANDMTNGLEEEEEDEEILAHAA